MFFLTNEKIIEILFVVLFVLIFTHNEDFVFKTLTTTCDNFTIKGKLINNDEKVGVIKVAHASTEDSPIFENFSKSRK